MEEGRAHTELRGGGGSIDSLEKDFYQRERPKKSKKKLCKWYLLACKSSAYMDIRDCFRC